MNSDLSTAWFDSTTVFSFQNPNTFQVEGANLSGTNAVLDGITGNVDFSGVNLAGVSFMNSDLSAAIFDANTVFSFQNPNTFQQEGANLSGTNAVLHGITGNVDFRGVNLAGVSFMNSDLSTACLIALPYSLFRTPTLFRSEGANLSGTNAVLDGITGNVDFRGVNLAGVSFMNSDLSTAWFDSTTVFSFQNPNTFQVEGANLSGTNAVLDGITGNVDFSGVNLAGVSFMNSDLSAAMFDANTVFSFQNPNTFQQEGANLSGTNAVLHGITGNVDFRGVNLAGVSFMNSDLSTAWFDSTTVFSFQNPNTFQVEGANLSGTNAVLDGITGNVDFSGVNLAGVSFMNSDLSAAMFDANTVFSFQNPNTFQQEGANLSGTNAVLHGITGNVDFRGVNLAGVSFMNSDLSTAMV